MLFSILIPVYNSELYIEECLDSILSQTYMDYECIIIDDGSTDNSITKMLKIIGNDKRFKIISRGNRGIAKTRNELLDNACGEYVVWVDSDDFLDNDYLESLSRYICLSSADAYILGYNIFSDNNIMKERVLSGNLRLDRLEVMKMLAKEYKMPGFLWNKIFKKSTYTGINFPEDVQMLEDWSVIPAIINNCDMIFYIDIAKYYYRQVESSITHNVDFEMMTKLNNVIKTREDYIIKHYPECIKELMIGKVYRAIIFINNYGLKSNEFHIDAWGNEVRRNLYVFIFDNMISNKLKIMAIAVAINPHLYIIARGILKRS